MYDVRRIYEGDKKDEGRYLVSIVPNPRKRKIVHR